jgi:SAM-dependent MidA family methyltransferase
MPSDQSLVDLLRKLLVQSDLPFRDFVELALYHPVLGYYVQARSPIGREGDFITSPVLSPLFSATLSELIGEFLRRSGDGVSQVVDVGCGDGALISALARNWPTRAAFFGVDRSLSRVQGQAGVTFVSSLGEIPSADTRLLISNELFDALPFGRFVQRDDHLQELWVTERDGALDWTEHEASGSYEDYFAERGVALESGQFADVSLDWANLYEDLCRFVPRGLIVTFDYGLPESKLFRGRMRRFGTAAAYSRQRVSRNLLSDPGEQDLTAHINFDDLRRTGERHGFTTRFFDIQAKFLLTLGAAGHELLKPVGEIAFEGAEEGIALLAARDDAKRLILPDGIGADIRVLAQERGMGPGAWSFEKKLF